MELLLSTDRSRYSLLHPVIGFRLRGLPTADDAAEENRYGRYAFYIDGKQVDRVQGDPRQYEIRLLDFRDRFGERVPVSFQLTYQPVGRIDGAEHPSLQSNPIALELDLRDMEILKSPMGVDSQYLLHQQRVYFLSNWCEGRRQWRLQANAETAQALHASSSGQRYLRDNTTVYSNGRALKGLDPASFRVLNGIFASDGQTVITSYGNAKVVDPSTFVVLDDGNQDLGTVDRVVSGYARDACQGYWFTNSTDSRHAMVIRACKHPASLESLGKGVARDHDHVYLEGARIPSADPHTWRPINRLYSRDAKHLFYLTRKLVGADPDTFKVLESRDPLDTSYWSRDKTGHYCRWEAASPEAYQHEINGEPNRPLTTQDGAGTC